MTLTYKKPKIIRKNTKKEDIPVLFRIVASKEKPTSKYPVGEFLDKFVKMIEY